ncbi:hypothetical protein [Paenibacillus sp. sgz500958]|uniref:hypothetical protein n=1 Tax=Paenibacillus sp. sgz500958 TaxID=3242475 RepID=UPI0036D34580
MEDVTNYFSYIQNKDLVERIKTEYINARFIYKMFEGLAATDDLLLAQVRVQIIMYTSIYEAIIHEVLFEQFKTELIVEELKYIKSQKQISIPNDKKKELEGALTHMGKPLLVYYEDFVKRDITKIRFDEKCQVAQKLNLITSAMCGKLIELYNIRNAVHIHAELRKSIKYELQMSLEAFTLMKEFNKHINDGIIKRKLETGSVTKIAPTGVIANEISFVFENNVFFGKWRKTLFRISDEMLDKIVNELVILSDETSLGHSQKNIGGLARYVMEKFNESQPRMARLYGAILLYTNRIELTERDNDYLISSVS